MVAFQLSSGHLPWCPPRWRHLGSAHHGCYYCKGQAYALAMVVGALMSALQFWGSQRTGSLGLLSDTWHLAFDSFGYLIGALEAFLIIYLTFRVKQVAHFRRLLEICMVFFLSLTAVIILYESGERLIAHRVPDIRDTGLLFGIALLGLVVNVALLWLFHAFNIEHEHGTSHHNHHHDGKDRILQSNILHTAGDALSSVFVVINAVIFSFTTNTNWLYLDLVAAVFIACLLLVQAIKLLRS